MQTPGRVLVETVGGLGNQLFQIAAGLAYGWRTGRPVSFPRGWSSKSVLAPRTSHWHTLFTGLNQLGGRDWAAAVASGAQVYDDYGMGFRAITPKGPQTVLLRGYFQHRDYLDGQLARLVQGLFPEHLVRYARGLLVDLIGSPEVGQWAFLHVRRGDYLKLGHTHPVLPPSYYDRAARQFDKGVRFIVFCEQEDVAAIRADFAKLPELTARIGAWVDPHIPDYLQLLAMAQCGAGGIVANSSFSCWAAYAGTHFSEGSRYVAPMRWFVDAGMSDAVAGVCLPGWIRIPDNPNLPALTVQPPARNRETTGPIVQPLARNRETTGSIVQPPARNRETTAPIVQDGEAAKEVSAEEWRPRGVVWCGDPHERNLEAISKGCAHLGVPVRRAASEAEARDLSLRDEKGADVYWFPNKVVASGAEFAHRRLLYGPHVWYSDPALASVSADAPANAALICLSKWNADVYGEFGVRDGLPLLDVPFGLDTNLFCPPSAKMSERDCILIYHKHRSPSDLMAAVALLGRRHPADKLLVFRYGRYTRDEYKSALARCKFGAWIGGHESQGFALQEALAMNVPLLVWDVRSMYEELSPEGRPTYPPGDKLLLATSAPYWDDRCGVRVYAEAALGAALAPFEAQCALGAFQPRAFAVENLSIDACTRRLFKRLKCLTPVVAAPSAVKRPVATSTDERRKFHKYMNGVLVETGSYCGEGIASALAVGFKRVISFELSEMYYERCRKMFAHDPRVTLVRGDSAKCLLANIADVAEPITFWLDGHYSAGGTAFGAKVAPLIEELEQIKAHPIKTHTILVDDRRLLVPSADRGLDGKFDLTEGEVLAKLREINPNYQIRYEHGHVPNDIIVAAP
jgi:hypothetical protein